MYDLYLKKLGKPLLQKKGICSPKVGIQFIMQLYTQLKLQHMFRVTYDEHTLSIC